MVSQNASVNAFEDEFSSAGLDAQTSLTEVDADPGLKMAGQTETMRDHDLPDPPYISQWGDLACNVAVIERGEDPIPLHDWRADGYLSGEAYRLWSRNTCGLTCLQMILAADPGRWPDVPCKGALLAQAISGGVLTPHDDGSIGGLYYAPFVKWVAHDFGLEAVSRPELPIEEMAELVAAGEWYAMASVSYEIRLPEQEPTHTGGHLILVHRVEGDGCEDDGREGESGFSGEGRTGESGLHFVYHNPSGLPPAAPGLPGSAENATCLAERFARFYAGRGILVRRS